MYIEVVDTHPQFFFYSQEVSDGTRKIFLRYTGVEDLTPVIFSQLSKEEQDFVAYYKKEIAKGSIEMNLQWVEGMLTNQEACRRFLASVNYPDSEVLSSESPPI